MHDHSVYCMSKQLIYCLCRFNDNGIPSEEDEPSSSPPSSPPSSLPSSPLSSPPTSPSSLSSFLDSEGDTMPEYYLDDGDMNVDDNCLSEELFNPLYSGATTTRCGAYCAIMHFATQNKLPYTAIEQLLDLLQLLCPQPNVLPTSFYKLKKFFKQFGAQYEETEYCTNCNTPVASCSSSTGCTCVQATGRGHLVHVQLDKSIKTLISSKFRPCMFS